MNEELHNPEDLVWAEPLDQISDECSQSQQAQEPMNEELHNPEDLVWAEPLDQISDECSQSQQAQEPMNEELYNPEDLVWAEPLDQISDDNDEDYVPNSCESEDDDDDDNYIDFVQNMSEQITKESVTSTTPKDKENFVRNTSEPITNESVTSTDPKDKENLVTSTTNEDDEPSERLLKDYEIIRDKDCPNIYIKKYQKSDIGKGKRKMGDRPYDTVHSCKYCGQLFTHIQNHIENKHRNQSEIGAILNLKKDFKENPNDRTVKENLKKIQDRLRFEGDHAHNEKVIKFQRGELIVQRKSCCRDEAFSHKDFGPCPNWFFWLNINSSVVQHQKICKALDQSLNVKLRKSCLVLQVNTILKEDSETTSPLLNKKVFPIMRNDEISNVAKQDLLITRLGDVWLSKSLDNKMLRYRTSSFRMRLAARLLIETRKRQNDLVLTMFNLLKPGNFDMLMSIALFMCEHSDGDGDNLNHPSVALKVGYDLTRLVGLKYALCIKDQDGVGKSDAKDVLQLLKLQWSTKVSKFAHSVQKERHFENRRKLPHPKDIQTVAEKLERSIKGFSLDNKYQYIQICRTALPRLMTYNRRRSGEIEALSLERYHKKNNKIDDVEEALLGNLTTLEKYLLESQELIWIRGKRGKKVPVLIPPSLSRVLKYVADGDGVFSSWKCLKDIAEEYEAELIHPARLSSTGYRAYMATIAQCIGLQDHQVQWVCTHLGHTEDVHKTHYRFTLGGVERIQLGKMLLLQDKNLVSKFQGKGLEEIQFEDIVSNIDVGEEGAPERLNSLERDGETSNFELDEENDEMGNILDDQMDLDLDLGPKAKKGVVVFLLGSIRKSAKPQIAFASLGYHPLKRIYVGSLAFLLKLLIYHFDSNLLRLFKAQRANMSIWISVIGLEGSIWSLMLFDIL